MRIANQVEMIQIGQDGGVFYPVLLWDDTDLVLIDAGLPGQLSHFVDAFSMLGFEISQLTALLLTHQDMDHIGCVKDLLALAPNANVYAHTLEAPYLDGRQTPVKLAAILAAGDAIPDEMRSARDRLAAGYANRILENIQEVSDGEILPFCGGIQVMHTPGHTPGHMVLLLNESRIAICGDAINLSNGSIVGPNPAYTLDMEEGLRSLEKIMAIEPVGVVAYHGGYHLLDAAIIAPFTK